MCGIAGVVGAESPQTTEARLGAMLAAQVHRGPDDHGVHAIVVSGAMVGLGTRRLSIQDPSSAGHQPMVNPDTGDVLVYNGEIYNFRDLRSSLEGLGHRFRGAGDTEVLLRAYQQWATGCLERIYGMFAFALWDARRARLVVARDHIGIKPLYYAELPAGFYFASEVRALLAGGVVGAEVDRRALAGYLAFGAVQEPLTIIRGVSCLPPGTWIEVDGSGRVVGRHRWWDLPAPEVPKGDPIEEGRAILKEAVRDHLVSDVALGVFLSSGIDSTTVAGVARRATEAPVRAFTVSFPDSPSHDEATLARATAERIGVGFEQCAVEDATARRWAEDGLGAMDQPALDGLNTYIVSRAAREAGFVVALSGLGGDEMFAGYRSFRRVPLWARVMGAAEIVPPRVRAALAALVAGRDDVARRKARDIAHVGSDLVALYMQYRRVMSNEDLARLGFTDSELGPAFLSPMEPPLHLPEEDPVASVARLETRFYLLNTLLRDADVFGMANSLEVRVPLLDRRVVEFALRLPGRAVLPPGLDNKPLLRHIGAEALPRPRGPKRGFVLPFSRWLQGPLADLKEGALSSLRSSGLVAPDGIAAIEKTFLARPRGAAWSRVWTLVALGHWIDARRSSALSGKPAGR